MSHDAQRRIAHWDGLRAVAILAVMLYHYFARWTPPLWWENLYPYADLFAGATRYGYLGVQLFFVISGYVIAMTLRRCADWREFAVRRLARLWPTMALCSCITFIGMALMQPADAFKVSGWFFLPSLTFIHPAAFRAVLHQPVDWMDGVYWSLFAEVRFYAWMAVLYFVAPRRFPQTLAIASSIVLAAWVLLGQPAFLKWPFVADQLAWFVLGVGLFYRHAALLGIGVLSIVLEHDPALTGGLLVIGAILIGCDRAQWVRSLFSGALLSAIGRASYSLYLLHQAIGVTLIATLARALGLTGWAAVPIACGVSVTLILAAAAIYRYWETPANRWLASAGLGYLGHAAARPMSAVRSHATPADAPRAESAPAR